MKKIHVIALTMALTGASISCSDDFLDVQPVGAVSQSVLTTGPGIKSTLVGAYALLNGGGGLATGPQQILFGSIRGGQGHKASASGDQPQMLEVEQAQMGTNNSSSQSLFTFYYNAIDRCNLVLKLLPQVPTATVTNSTTGLTDAERRQITAETRFLRAHYYFYVKRLFKNIPWIDETLNVSLQSLEEYKVPNTDASGNYVDIWSKIKDDMDFARKNLNATNLDWGRPNSWAAEAYYGKILLYMGNEGAAGAYAEALTVFNTVIASGKNNAGTAYALNLNYRDNYNCDKENGQNLEWVWGVQGAVNDGTPGTTAPNAFQDGQYTGTQAGGALSPGFGRGFGFFTASTWFVNYFRTDALGLPILDDATRNNATNAIKNDDGISAATAFTPDTGLIDPRLDWSVGRRGIPYYDYGNSPGPSWLRDAAHGGPFMTKKYYIWLKDDGKYTPAGSAQNAMNVPVIRYADVILMRGELAARTGDLVTAFNDVNTIRNRMKANSGSADHWVKTYATPSQPGLGFSTTNAANYKVEPYLTAGVFPFDNATNALKAILFERNLELGLEGHNGYDLVRFGFADGVTDVNVFNAYLTFEKTKRSFLLPASYSIVPDRLAPIPQQGIDNSLKDGVITLKQNPGY